MDSQGRLFVGDRQNNRIQIFDQDGKFLDQWTQFSRPSGIFIDGKDNIYVADSESESVSKNHDGWKRGIRIGSAKDGSVTAFIPDPVDKTTGTSAAEGVAADAAGNIYGAEVGPKRMMKYVGIPSGCNVSAGGCAPADNPPSRSIDAANGSPSEICRSEAPARKCGGPAARGRASEPSPASRPRARQRRPVRFQ